VETQVLAWALTVAGVVLGLTGCYLRWKVKGKVYFLGGLLMLLSANLFAAGVGMLVF